MFRRTLPFVADADGEGVRDKRILQGVLDPGDADMLHPVGKGPARKRIAGERRDGDSVVFQKKDPCVPAKKRRFNASFAGKAQSLNISHQVIEPAAQRAIEPDLRKPSETAQRTAAIVSVSSFSTGRSSTGTRFVALTFIRIKIPHEKVRANTGFFCIGIAPVAGDDKIRVPDAG